MCQIRCSSSSGAVHCAECSLLSQLRRLSAQNHSRDGYATFFVKYARGATRSGLKQRYAALCCCAHERFVLRGEGQLAAQGEIEVGCVIGGELVFSGEEQYFT